MAVSSNKSVLALLWLTLISSVVTPCALAATSDASSLLRQKRFRQLDSEFSAVQRRFERGSITGDEERNAFRAFYPTDHDLAPMYDQWVAAFPNSYVAHVARAIYFKKRGFEERGGKMLAHTSQAQIENMDSSLGKAIKDFGDSIPMTAKPFLSYLHMLDISSNYAAPAYSRKLYDQAIALDARSLAVREKYMLALAAKWGGSLDEMRRFFAECRTAGLPAAELRQLESMVSQDEGWELANDGDYAGAEAAYRKAVSLDPPDCTSCIVSSLVDALMKQRKYADALPFLNDYLAEKPTDLWGRSNRGLALFETGNQYGAFSDWRISANQGDAFSQNRLGVLYMTGIAGKLAADPNAGIAWLKESASQGNADAQRNLPLAMAQVSAQAVGR